MIIPSRKAKNGVKHGDNDVAKCVYSRKYIRIKEILGVLSEGHNKDSSYLKTQYLQALRSISNEKFDHLKSSFKYKCV